MQDKRIWIGRYLVAVALIHTAFGLIAGAGTLRQMLAIGVFNSAEATHMSQALSWYLLFGAPLALLGMSITLLERSGTLAGTRGLGIGLLCLLVAGVVLMPMSGFWLIIPPVIALLRHSANPQHTAGALTASR